MKSEKLSLTTPSVDCYLLGGAYLIFAVSALLLLPAIAPDTNVLAIVFIFSIIAELPHLVLSYELLYVDFRHLITRNIQFFAAAVALPMALIAVIVVGFFTNSPSGLGYLIALLTAAWGLHFAQQTYVCMNLSNALKGYTYQPLERLCIGLSLVSTWLYSIVLVNSPHDGRASYQYFNVPYPVFTMPPGLYEICVTAMVVTFLAVVGIHIKRYIDTGEAPSWPSILAYLMLVAWYLPITRHPHLIAALPIFHSLQYLALVFALRSAQVRRRFGRLNTADARAGFVKAIYGRYGLMLTLSALLYVGPHFIDTQGWLELPEFGISPISGAVITFVNLHHMLIDAVVWQKDFAYRVVLGETSRA